MSKVEYAVEMIDITKIFNETVVANKNITLRVKKGEIHALIGENGAGKTTLMSILFGMYNPTSGLIKINDLPVIINNPIKANSLGIGMVHQHFKLVEIYTVWQNIALGVEDTIAKVFVNSRKIKSDIKKLCDKYDLQVDLNARISDISVGMQQRVEILKILYRGADIIVLDEPTAVLTPQEIHGLLNIILRLQKDGKTIIFITHKLNEIKTVANRGTVIRLGQLVGTFNVKDLTEGQIAEMMVGRKIINSKNTYTPPSNEVVIETLNLNAKKISNPKVKGLIDFNLKVHAGEIVAIAGVEGNGQRELINCLTGLSKASSGQMFFKNVPINNLSIRERYKLGMSHIPEDRQKYGLILDYTIINNMVLQNVDSSDFSNHKILQARNIQEYAQRIIYKYDVRGSRNGFELARALSGGNQQKAILGRELTRDHKFVIIAQPTRGLDVGAIEFIHNQLLQEKARGIGILLISYELEEVMSLADRIIVISRGMKIGEMHGREADRKVIGLMMAGKYVNNKKGD